MRPALVILLLAGCLKAQSGGVAGVVVDQSTGQPLRGVHVRLITGEFGSNGGVDAVYGVTSDAAGRFSVEGLKPGLYMLMAERAGFIQVATAAGFAQLTLKPGQQLTDYKVTMTARAVIAGRVVDEYGDPVEGLPVQAQTAGSDLPQGTMFGNSNATTDDRGEFRLTTAPGKYYLKAAVYNRQEGAAEIRTDGTPGAPFVTTYYPNAANTGAASVVQVAAGQDLAGMEIRMTRAKVGPSGRGLTVSGTVTGIPDNGFAWVMLRFGETAETLNETRMAGAQEGKFSFAGMQPGYYCALAYYSQDKISLQSRAVTFHLAESDETGVQLVLAPGEELAGTLALVGDAPAGAPEKLTVRLVSAGGFNVMGQTEPHAAEVGKDGSFRIANVPAGKFTAVVEPMPENAYVKEVALDGKTAVDRVLDLSQGAGGSRIKIIVSRAGGRISGKISDKDGEPVLGMVMVFLMTDPKNIEEGNTDRVMDGKYSFKGIHPGRYRLIALDMLEMASAFGGGGNEAEAMKQFFDAAEEIEVKEGDRISKDIPALTKAPEKK